MTMTTTTTQLLIDGDIVLYQISSAIEEPINWGDDIWTLHGDVRLARQSFDQEIQKICDRLGVQDVVITLSDPKQNWRLGVLDTYKHNRRNKRKPVVYRPLRDHILDAYETACYPTLEADDVMGILSGEGKIVVSDDKDLRCIPGQLYRPSRDDHIEITVEEADRNHLTQALTGDSVDGYSGCPGIGPKRAADVLIEGTWAEVVGAYEKAGLNETEALRQARVARILRHDEWDTVKQEVLLWNPI